MRRWNSHSRSASLGLLLDEDEWGTCYVHKEDKIKDEGTPLTVTK